jgi:Ca2+-binding EF-hand superfamily protein
MTPFRQEKITREFHLLDVDRDGVISQRDFDAAADRLVASMGLDPEDEAAQAIHRERRQIWEELCVAADFDQSGAVDLREYLDFYRGLTEAMSVERPTGWFRRVSAVHLHSMDLDKDGQISLEDYRTFLEAHGAREIDAAACFERLDLDGNGFLDPEENVLLSLHYYLGDDPSLPGNWLWGPPPCAP